MCTFALLLHSFNTICVRNQVATPIPPSLEPQHYCAPSPSRNSAHPPPIPLTAPHPPPPPSWTAIIMGYGLHFERSSTSICPPRPSDEYCSGEIFISHDTRRRFRRRLGALLYHATTRFIMVPTTSSHSWELSIAPRKARSAQWQIA